MVCLLCFLVVSLVELWLCFFRVWFNWCLVLIRLCLGFLGFSVVGWLLCVCFDYDLVFDCLFSVAIGVDDWDAV